MYRYNSIVAPTKSRTVTVSSACPIFICFVCQCITVHISFWIHVLNHLFPSPSELCVSIHCCISIPCLPASLPPLSWTYTNRPGQKSLGMVRLIPRRKERHEGIMGVGTES
ncbi:unnamed protein product [Choristocarpus tenellus]